MRKESPHSRRALVQLRFLFGAAVLCVGGAAWVASAQTSSLSPVKMTIASAGKNRSKPVTLSDLPGMVETYGAARQQTTSASTSASLMATRNVSTGASGYNLVETDLTPNSPSDEREPAYSPGGDFIVFRSNGADADGDGTIDSINAENKTHIWLMNRDGTDQRQLTGLGVDKTRNQSRPSWSPDGNQVVYVDDDPDDATSTQLWVVQPFSDQDGDPTDGLQLEPAEQRTFFKGKKEAPAWSPSGLAIAFATNYDALPADTNAPLGQKDIFSISPDGNLNSLTRLTGGTADPVGNSTDDTNPAYALVNQNVMFFSSNRDKNGLLTGAAVKGRRIWKMFIDGSSKVPFTDPTVRTDANRNTVGRPDDQDDFPAPSLRASFNSPQGTKTVAESIAFQTNTYLDASDAAKVAGRDLNVWTLPYNTSTDVFSPTAAEPLIYLSSFNSSRVLTFDTETGLASDNVPPIALTGGNPEGIGLRGLYLYVSDRGGSAIDRYLQADGTPAPGAGLAGANYTNALAPQASGLLVDDNYIYVASGNSGTATPNTTALYRFNIGDGSPAPRAGATAGTAIFSALDSTASGGTSDAGKVIDGAEGLSFYSTAAPASFAQNYIFVSVYSDDKVNVYNKTTGDFVAVFVPNSPAGDTTRLDGPTGLAWGPDINGDGFPDLYVNSSAGNAVKVYAGFNPTDTTMAVKVGVNADVTPGTLIGDLIPPARATATDLHAPEGLGVLDRDRDGTYEVYVSDFQGTANGGTHVNRYKFNPATAYNTNTGVLQSATPFPLTTTADPNNAVYLQGDTRNPANYQINGPGYFAFNTTALNTSGTTTPTTLTPVETARAAVVVSNILSSPQNFADSRLKSPNTVDQAADREPTYSRVTGTAQLLARLALASTRVYEPNTSSNGSTTKANPYGGDQLLADGSSNPTPTHDIWSVSTQDTTPPALVPQGAGNLQYPVVAPQPDAPFTAPRTAEEGLKAGAKAAADGLSGDASALHLAVVFRDVESGLNETYGSRSVTAQIFKASAPQFTTMAKDPVNSSIPVNVSVEQKAQIVSIGGLTTFELHVYDDGPASSGGHEQQAGAVAGDGVFYCEAILPTPAASDDYYIDITAADRKGNSFTYDNIWGFSTKLFQKQANTKTDLFVSDYTCGQNFPETVASTSNLDDGRFNTMLPIESYWLTNPGGAVLDANGNVIARSTTTTFSNVDIWRVLCRGPVPQTVLDSYRPRITKQLDPNDPTGKFVDKTRDVAVSDTAVIWAAPYAGTSFVGPGTIVDPTIQARLENFLSNGGRLFISGRDIAWALSSDGALPNDFLNKYLSADFNGEGYAGGSIITDVNGFGVGDLQVPSHITNPLTDSYQDAAFNMDGGTIASELDYLTPQATSGATLSTAYTFNGNPVGQRVVKTQTSGLESRVVFFSFGFEAVNRRYVPNTISSLIPQNARSRIAGSILQYFKTGSVSGSVINNATNLPIANFLLQVSGAGGTYLVRTDTNGNYALTGLPPGGYTVQPFLRNGLTDPEGYFGGTAQGFTVNGGGSVTGINLRPIPTVPGAIIGRATASNNTPASKKLPNGNSGRSDDIPLANTPVLVYSVNSSSIFPGGGQFARLAATDAGGKFSVSNVPAGAKMVVVFNPNQSDIPKGSNLTAPARNSKYGRRVVPDSKRPDDIIVPSGDNFILNDVIPTTEDPASTAAQQVDDKTDNGVPVVVPSGPSINVAATFNDAIVDPAVTPISVTLFSVASDGTQTAVDTQVASATTGAVTFEDLPPGKYLLTGTITLADGTVITRNSSTLTLVQGSDLPVNLQLYAVNIVGKVLKNGQPLTSAATVTLYNTDGTAVTPARSVTTAADGTYRITLVAPGRYVVKANQGGVEGTATVVVGHAPVAGNGSNGYDTPAPDINLNQRILSGVVNFIYGGDNVRTATPLAGARVDLYVQNGTKPYKTVTSGSDGSFGFVNVPAGNYYIVATYPPSAIISDTVQSPVFAVSTNSTTPVQKLTIILHKITVKTVDSSGNPISGATVGLYLKGGTTAVATGTTAGGQFLFDQVVASPTGTSYEVHASTGNLSGSLVLPTFRRNAKPFTVTVTLTAGATNVDNPTVFAVGKTYLISLPYETSANRRTSNVSPDHMVGSGIEQDVATIKVSEAFNVPPVVGNTTYYNLSAYNPTTLNYEKLTADSLLKRGVGYVLQVLTRPAGDDVKLNLPGNPASFRGQVLDDRTRQKEFTIKLTYPVSLNGNAAAGRNLIGFGFDPSKYSIVPWDANDDTKTYVEVLNGANSYSLKQAVKLKLINGALQTIDPATGKTVNASGITKFGGCWVQSYVNGLQLVLHTK